MNWTRDDAGREVIHGRPVMTDEECGASEAAGSWRARLDIGMYALDSAGQEIGQVKEIRSGSFLVDLRNGGPVDLPFERIDDIDGDRVRLDVSASGLEAATVPRSSFSEAPPAGDSR